MSQSCRPTIATVDLGAVVHNLRHARETSGGAAVCAVVKADAYGHGAVPVARALEAAGADWLAVALVEEGLVLREAGIRAPILVLGGAYGKDGLAAALAAKLTPSLGSIAGLAALAAQSSGSARFHLKVDTGMGRLGVREPELDAFLDRLLETPRLELEGLFSHFANADLVDREVNAAQLEAFARILERLAARGVRPRLVHLANSAATLTLPSAHHRLVRPGLMLYGMDPTGGEPATLRPALRWTTEIIHLKEVPTGTRVSYGGTWTATRPSRIATLPIGYADGYPRALSNRAEALVRGRRARIAGRVCMDLCMLDVTDVSGVSLGDEVVLLGSQGSERITAHTLARWADTIAYEITCGIQARVPRRYLEAEASAR